MRKFPNTLRHWLAREDGSTSVEFVTIMPLAVAVFLASAESGIISLRKTFLDRALEYTVRELRLGKIADTSAASLKAIICSRMTLVDNCANNLRLEMNVVSTSVATSLVMPSTTSLCIDRSAAIVPPDALNFGVANDLVLVRACLVQDIVFPTSTAQVAVGDPTNDEYQLISTTVFVNEPS
ncbi:MAG: pilus assembly protein [Cypionkella sp.]|nr:pilus assembly protein [Cypionkella sp.]